MTDNSKEIILFCLDRTTTECRTSPDRNKSLRVEHECNNETNCSLMKNSSRYKKEGVHMISHEPRDYGKVDLAFLNRYPRLLSMSHYEIKEKQISKEITNDKIILTEPIVELTEQKKVFKKTQLKRKPTKEDEEKDINKLTDDDLKQMFKIPKLNAIEPKERKEIKEEEDSNSWFKLKELTKPNQTRINEMVKSQKKVSIPSIINEPVTVDKCLKDNSGLDYKQLFLQYKGKVTDNEYSNREEMKNNLRNSAIIPSKWDNIKSINDLSCNEYLQSESNDYCHPKNICDLKKKYSIRPKPIGTVFNQKNTKPYSIDHPKAQISQYSLRTVPYDWWLYYNTIIYPSNSIEETRVKIGTKELSKEYRRK